MKRIIMLVVVALLLVGCGLDSVPQGSLSNSISMGWDEGVAAATAPSVECDVHPIVGSHQAQVSCQLEIVDDSVKLGEVLRFHLAGVLVMSESESAFVDGKLIRSSGKFLSGWPSKVVDLAEMLGVIELTAELDDFRSPVGIVGAVTMEGAKELTVPTSDKNETNTLAISTCEGKLIPNSRLAIVTFTGKGTTRNIAGGGLLDTNLMSLDEMCHEVSAEGVVFEVEATLINLEDIKGEFKSGLVSDRETGRPIFQGVIINHEEQ